jgi:hypothetical protein
MRISSQLLVAVAVAEEPEMELQIYQLRIQVIPLTEQMCLVQMEQPQQTVEQTSTVVVVVVVVVVGMAAQEAQQLFHLGDQSAQVLEDLAAVIMLQVMH